MDQGFDIPAAIGIAGQRHAVAGLFNRLTQFGTGREASGLNHNQGIARRVAKKVGNDRGLCIADIAQADDPAPAAETHGSRFVAQPAGIFLKLGGAQARSRGKGP